MNPAAKHFDPVLGIDIHIIQPPGPVPPVPVPHPFIGFIMDPMDYLPIIGSTVNINFLPRALAGTQGICVPPHIPIGGMFVKPPANECEMFMGSATVNCDGDALSYMGLPALSCHCIGMPPIPRIRKKGAVKSLVLPTSNVLPIPAGPPVLVGGPPTISLMAMAMKVGMAAVGKAAKKFMNTKAGKALKNKYDNVKAKFKTKTPSHNKACGRPGEPIDVVTGANVDDFLDWAHPLFPMFTFQRFYNSLFCHEQDSCIGQGFRHIWQHELRFLEDRVQYRDPEGDLIELPLPQEQKTNPKMMSSSHGGYTLSGSNQREWLLTTAHSPSVYFKPSKRPVLYAARISQFGVSIALDYDENDSLIAVSNERGEQVNLNYDHQGRLRDVSMRTPTKDYSIATFSYDSKRRLAQWVDAMGSSSSYQYDDNHRMTKKTDRNGYSFHYQYDTDGRCVHSFGDDGLYDLRFEYEPEKRATRVIWADGAEHSYSYNENGVITKWINPSGGMTLFELGGDEQVVVQIEPNGDAIQQYYTASGALVERQDASGQYLLPMHIEPVQPNGLAEILPATPFEWTWGAYAWELGGSDSTKTALQKWAPSLITSMEKNDEKKEWQNTFSSVGRLEISQQSQFRYRQWKYDSNGNVTLYRDESGATTQSHYSSWNQLTHVQNAIGGKYRFARNLREQPTALVDAGDTETIHEYDSCDRIVSTSRGGQLLDRYVYSAQGDLLAKLDCENKTLARFEAGPYSTYRSIELEDTTLSFKHDARSRVIAASAPNIELELAYESSDVVKTDKRNKLGIAYQPSLTGAIEAKIFNKFTVGYTRGEDGCVYLKDPTGMQHTIAFDSGRTVARKMGDGLVEVQRFSRDGNRTRQQVLGHGETKIQRDWTYSDVGELIKQECSDRGSVDYEYDQSHRLAAMRSSKGKTAQFKLDLAGNVLAKPGFQNVKLSKANQLQSHAEESFEYNVRGHLSKRTSVDGRCQHYKYNGLDQLISITEDSGWIWNAVYDPLQRRVQKSWGEGVEKHQTDYYWESNRLLAEMEDQKRLRIYVYADRRSFVPIMMVDYESMDASVEKGKRFYLISDQRGQINEVFDSTGMLIWQVDAAPYGEVTQMKGEVDWFSMRMPGHYADGETGLYYNRFRYYDPKMARYIQSDPIGLDGGWNTYAYVADPLNNVDLQGLHGKQTSKGKTGSVKPSKIAGMTDEAFESLARTSSKHNVRIRVRPSNPDCLPHIKNGHPKKPEFIKNKTINKTDALMGPPPKPGNEGLVGHYKPPSKADAVQNAEEKLGRKLTKEEAEKLESRRAQRLAEFNQNDKYLREGAVDANGNQVLVDPDRGVLVDNRPGPTQGKEFTGDHDLFDVQQKGPDGKWQPADKATNDAVVNDLKNDPNFEAQHGDHQSWKYDESDAQAKNIDKNIKEGHQPGGEPLVDVYPDGTTGTSHYDGPIPD